MQDRLRAPPVLVGRDGELAELLAGLDDAACGAGRLFLLAGAPPASQHRPHATVKPRSRARAAASYARRLFPIPGSPASKNNRPVPQAAASSPASSSPSSPSRPTSTGAALSRSRTRPSLVSADSDCAGAIAEAEAGPLVSTGYRGAPQDNRGTPKPHRTDRGTSPEPASAAKGRWRCPGPGGACRSSAASSRARRRMRRSRSNQTASQTPENPSLYRGGQRIVSSTQIPGPGSDSPQEMEEHPWKDA